MSLLNIRPGGVSRDLEQPEDFHCSAIWQNDLLNKADASMHHMKADEPYVAEFSAIFQKASDWRRPARDRCIQS